MQSLNVFGANIEIQAAGETMVMVQRNLARQRYQKWTVALVVKIPLVSLVRSSL